MTRSDLFEAPENIGPYRILGVLGEGGMGVVYEADQKEPVRRRVAIKMMKVGMDTKEVMGRFDAERGALAVMEHPGIARVLDAGATEAGRPYFVMELVRGVPIDSYCNRRKLTIRQRIELLIRVCEAVQHAHQKGVIHRDLKPNNVMVIEVSGRPEPKVIDFGIAKATGQQLTEHTVLTTYGQAVGTLAYMSPEQAEMSGLDVDTRTDVYALGVLLHQLITGRVPLDPMTVGGAPFLAQLILEDRPWPTLPQHLAGLDRGEVKQLAEAHGTEPTRFSKELRGDLQWVVMKAMEKDRTRRYETANALSSDLQRILREEPIEARPPSRRYRIGKFVRRNKVGTLAGAAAALALIAGATATTVGMLQAQAAQKLAAEEAETARQVSGFLVDLFQINDPSEARGNTVTAREVLDAGAERIQSELTDQPAVQARLMATIGAVYDGLGLWTDAGELVEESLRARREGEGMNDLDVAESLDRLASIRGQQGRFAEAERLQREALELRTRGVGVENLDVANSQHGLARVMSRVGRPDTAVILLDQALSTRLEILGEDHEDVIGTLMALSDAHLLLGDAPRAIDAASRAQGISERLFGEDPHPGRADIWSRLAGAHYAARNLRSAEAAHREALRLRQALVAPNHPSVLISSLNLGIVLHDQGEDDESEALIRHVFESVSAAGLPPNHAYVETSHVYLALLGARQAAAQAAPLAAEALARMEATPDPQAPRVMGTLSAVDLKLYASLANGRVLLALGRYDEAEPLLRSSYEDLSGDRGPQRREALDALVELYEKTGRLDEARAHRQLVDTGG